jgi:hypothetical protein
MAGEVEGSHHGMSMRQIVDADVITKPFIHMDRQLLGVEVHPKCRTIIISDWL